MDHDLAWIRTEFTVVRWHLDAAATSEAEAVRYHLQRARQAYERIVHTLARVDLTPEQRDTAERELADVRGRLDITTARGAADS